MFMKQTYSICS